MKKQNRFHWETRPLARKENIVSGETYRFTILTSQLIRMEFSENGKFEDRPSQSIFYRDFPEVSYAMSCENEMLKIETDKLILLYEEGKTFAANTLSVSLKHEPASCWHYGDDYEDLGGTYQTLDGADGAIPLERGVCSRYGFSIIDDSDTLVIGEDDWVAVRTPNTKDVYFFGYGYDYVAAVQDLYRLTGAPPMLPAYALGNWWSRYYKYTQQEYIDLMQRFKEEDIPFSVAVVDMDWHIVEVPEKVKEDKWLQHPGWTGYSWNRELFPDYKAFLKYLADNNLKTALNLHPADGCRCHEDMYEEMATACGIDPSTGERVPFDILSQDFMEKYFDILHHPYEEDGVNFWWMDWQQGTSYSWIHEPNENGKMQDEREILDPLWMLNHLHILDISRNGKRPMFFSRYSGPGSHRYPVGFSGDTIVTWESLKFQPYFTATASNIGYGWWSHDIGGHMYGYRDNELNARWIQLGVFSPINRLHSSCNVFVEKEPWAYDGQYEAVLKDWLRFRHCLFPYIYTMNYRTHKELLPLVQPMYYSHPKCSGAYEVPEQFWFGSELIVAPITEKQSPVSMLAKAEAWLPSGNWFDFFNGVHYASRRGRKTKLHRSIEEYPVLAKAGAIVPLAEHTEHDNKLGNAEHMEVVVFPGASNSFVLYEDEGDMHRFNEGAYVETAMVLEWGENPCFTIAAAKGDLSLIPKTRVWKIKLRGFHKDITADVLVDGKQCLADISLDVATNTWNVIVEASTTSNISVFIQGEELIHDNSDAKDRCLHILKGAQMEFESKIRIWNALEQENLSVHNRLFRMTGSTPDIRPVIEAIKEQLCLTEDEYLGSEIL